MKIYNPFRRQPTETKNISIGELDQYMRWVLEVGQGGQSGVASITVLRRAVPWLFRAIDLIAQSIHDFPFEIKSLNGETVIDSSTDWQNKLEFTNDLTNLFFKLSSSIDLYGAGYVKPMSNRLAKAMGVPSELRYWVKNTITPIVTETNGLEYFERKIGNASAQRIEVADLVYFWLPDPDVEVGAPLAYPAQAALNATGVLFSLDKFFSEHAQAGLIKAFIAAVKGAPPFGSEQGQGVKQKIEESLNRELGGQHNTGKIRAINADSLTITPVGEGLQELANVELTKEKREDIAMALGVPQTMLFSGDASGIGGGGVSKEDTSRFMIYNIVPRFNFIADIFNAQLFNALGYKIVGKPETLDVFQEDEVSRSQAYASYSTAMGSEHNGMIAEMLGIELPDGYEYDDLNKEPQPIPPALQPFAGQNKPPADNSMPMQLKPERFMGDPQGQAVDQSSKTLEAGQFKRYAAKHPDKVGEFTFHYLNADEQKALGAQPSDTGAPFRSYP